MSESKKQQERGNRTGKVRIEVYHAGIMARIRAAVRRIMIVRRY